MKVWGFRIANDRRTNERRDTTNRVHGVRRWRKVHILNIHDPFFETNKTKRILHTYKLGVYVRDLYEIKMMATWGINFKHCVWERAWGFGGIDEQIARWRKRNEQMTETESVQKREEEKQNKNHPTSHLHQAGSFCSGQNTESKERKTTESGNRTNNNSYEERKTSMQMVVK